MKSFFKLSIFILIILTALIFSGCGSSDIPMPETNDASNPQENTTVKGESGEVLEGEIANNSSECSHSYTEKVLVSATCQKEGLTRKTCALCGKTQSVSVPKAAHVEVTDAAIAATCTAPGKTEGKHCSVCNEVTVPQETIDALGHTEVIDEGRAATCTSIGMSEGKHCGVCNKILIRQEPTNPIPHTTEKIMTAVVTCKADGSVANKCTMCQGIIGDIEIISKGHFPEGHAHTKIEGLCEASTEGFCNTCEKFLIEPGFYTIGGFGSWCGTVQFKFEYYNTLNVKVTANQIVRTYNNGYLEKFGDAVVYDFENNIENQYDPVITITEETFAVVDQDFYYMFLRCFEKGEYTLSGTYEFTSSSYYIAAGCPEGITNLNFKYLDNDENVYYSTFIQAVETSDGPIVNYSNHGKVMYFSYQSEWGGFDDSLLQRYVIFETPQKVSKEFFKWFTSVAEKVTV